MTRRGLGPGVILESSPSGEEGRSEREFAEACRAVESLETNIEPALPGSPSFQTLALGNDRNEEKHTADNNGKHCKRFIPPHKHVEYDSRPAANDHRNEKWGPSLEKEMFDVRIASRNNRPPSCRDGEKND